MFAEITRTHPGSLLFVAFALLLVSIALMQTARISQPPMLPDSTLDTGQEMEEHLSVDQMLMREGILVDFGVPSGRGIGSNTRG